MRHSPAKLLVIGATGSVGRHVIDVALENKYQVRALIRSMNSIPDARPKVECIPGDVTEEVTLKSAVQGIDAVAFTHGTYGDMKAAETVDYGAVRNVLHALGSRKVRIALMTTIGATDRKGAHDWKRRGEWLVRMSGHPYTIVRPAWFDCNGPDEHQLLMLQGDKALVGSPKDGVISRRQLAEVLVGSLSSDAAMSKTFELHAVRGEPQPDLGPLFADLEPDTAGSIHGCRDAQNMLLENEPQAIRSDIRRVQDQAVSIQNCEAHFDL